MHKIFYDEFKKKQKIVQKMIKTAKNLVQGRTKKIGSN